MEWIEKYLDDRLTAGEMETFIKMQQEDSSFRELVNDMKLLVSGIKSSARESMAQEIREWENRQEKIIAEPMINHNRSYRRIGYISLAAAACLAVLLYFGVLRQPVAERMASSIYREYYDGPYHNMVALTYRSDANKTFKYQEAFNAYDLKDFQKASELLSAIPQKSDTILFYLGNSWMAVKEFEKAGDCYRSSLLTGKFMADQARWYLALALLKSGKLDEAEPVFRELTTYRNYYQEKAMEISSKLSTFHQLK